MPRMASDERANPHLLSLNRGPLAEPRSRRHRGVHACACACACVDVCVYTFAFSNARKYVVKFTKEKRMVRSGRAREGGNERANSAL